jgi:hypothetical protein
MDKHFSDIINTFKKLNEAPSYNPNTMPANPGGTQTPIVAKQVRSNNDSTGMSQFYAHLADKDEKRNLLAFQKGMMNAQLELDIARKLGGKPPKINSRGTGIFSHMNTEQFGQWLASHPDAYKAFSDDPQKNQSAPVKQNVPPSQQVAQNQQAQSSMPGLAEGEKYQQYKVEMIDRNGKLQGIYHKDSTHYNLENMLSDIKGYQRNNPRHTFQFYINDKPVDWKELAAKQGVEESKSPIYQGQFKTKEEAINYAKDAVKKFRDPEDGIEIWAMPSGGFDVVHTMNSNGRNHTIQNGGKKLGTIGSRYKGVAEATSDPKFDKMLKNITGKKAVAKQQKADKKQQARDAFDGMFGGGNPADKLTIRKKGVTESDDIDTGVVIKKLQDMVTDQNDVIANAYYDNERQNATIVRDRALKALHMIKSGSADVSVAWKYFITGEQGVAEGSMDDAEHNPEGPKFGGYWKGTDKNPPKPGMGVGGTSESTEYQGFHNDGRLAAIHGKPNQNPFTEPKEKEAAAAWQKGYDSYKPKVGHSISTNNKSHKGIVERVDDSHVYFRTPENKLFRTKSRNVHQTVDETIIASSGTGTASATPNPEAVAANAKASNDVMNKLKTNQLVDPKQQSAVKKALDPTANAGGDLSKMNPQAKAGSAGEGMKILGALQQAAKPAGQGGDPAKLNQITKMIGDLNKKAQM